MENNQGQEPLRCDYCKGEIFLGRDVVRVEKSVNGPRGVIPLGEAFTFCSEACVSRFFDREPIDDLPEIQPRIP